MTGRRCVLYLLFVFVITLISTKCTVFNVVCFLFVFLKLKKTDGSILDETFGDSRKTGHHGRLPGAPDSGGRCCQIFNTPFQIISRKVGWALPNFEVVEGDNIEQPTRLFECQSYELISFFLVCPTSVGKSENRIHYAQRIFSISSPSKS